MRWSNQPPGKPGRFTADRPVFAEYLAEATPAPILMIRRGRYKFIWSSEDSPLLYDLIDDPSELTNLADSPEHADVVHRFRAGVAQKWDSEALTDSIRLSQRRRRLVMAAGDKPRWNHGEVADDKVLWYRGQGSYNDWAFAYLPVRETAAE